MAGEKWRLANVARDGRSAGLCSRLPATAGCRSAVKVHCKHACWLARGAKLHARIVGGTANLALLWSRFQLVATIAVIMIKGSCVAPAGVVHSVFSQHAAHLSMSCSHYMACRQQASADC